MELGAIPELDIFPSVQYQVLNNRSGINSLKYFSDAIKENLKARTNPMPLHVEGRS